MGEINAAYLGYGTIAIIPYEFRHLNTKSWIIETQTTDIG
jgi:hypothetical protein